ncbi:MAG: peptide-methionine (S)-S-oxide reductase MsrA [Clostridium sp.]
MKTICFAGGCFWGVEEFFSRINGVIETEVGYANGTKKNPTYEEVCSKTTGFAEVCKVVYDPSVLSLEELLKEYWSIVEPTVLNRQGNDIGSQYRTGLYFIDMEDVAVLVNSKEKEQKNYDKPIVTEIIPLRNYYPAEEYHQKYLKKNPGGYCHINL